MSTAGQPLRVELTILDQKLYRPEVKFYFSPVPHLLYSTPYREAVSPPFPDGGKSGLSIFVGRREHFRQAEVRLLWELEKKRGRARMAVLTNLRGREFVPAFRELEGALAESHLTPLSFLRRRAKVWDSLDFFSSGTSPSMEGAVPRLKRLKQRGWETVADRLALADPAIKELYFETLHVDRPILQQALLENLRAGRVAGMVAIAGQSLQKEHLPLFLREEMNARIVSFLEDFSGPAPEHENWVYLSKRKEARELIFLCKGEKWLVPGDVLKGKSRRETRESELLVGELVQRLQMTVGDEIYTVARVAIEWRYRPAREIPLVWKQFSTSSAG